MALILKPLQRVLATFGLVVLVYAALLHQTSAGAVTPCRALYTHTRTHLPTVSRDVVEACLGARGEAGPVGLLVDLGLAVTGQSREKVARRVSERLDEQL